MNKVLLAHPDEIIEARWTPGMVAARSKYRCVHSHSGLSHKNCYVKELGIKERKGGLDIECGALNADFDICLSWAIKDIGGSVINYDHITMEDLDKGIFDARIIESCVSMMWNYTRLVTHYGSNFRFDIPFLRARYLWLKARGLYKGERFPGNGEMYVSDTFAFAKKLLKISSRRQDNIAYVVQNKDIKTRIDKNHWLAIKHGSHKQKQEAIKYIVEHNIADVGQLEENYFALLPFIRECKSSI